MTHLTEKKIEQIEQRLAFLESKLANLPEPTKTEPQPDVLDIDALIQYIGNVSKASVYRWVHFRTIPSYKVGKRVYFKRAEIDDWLLNQRRKTIAEVIDQINNR